MTRNMIGVSGVAIILLMAWSVAQADLVDNGDGTISDTDTGLMWQKAEAGVMYWEEALNYCENLQLAGYSDWRLPNRNELQSIVNYANARPAIDSTMFPNAMPSNYLSSTTAAESPDCHWYVNFDVGHVGYRWTKSLSRQYVRAVRAGQ